MRKKIATYSFWIGISLTIIGFFGDKADKIPFLLPLVAPSYARAAKGVETLEKKGELIQSDEGFLEIEQVLREQLNEKAKPNPFEYRKVNKFVNKRTVKTTALGDLLLVEVEFLDRKIPDWDIASIKRGIEPLKDKSILRFSTIILFLGILIVLINRLVEKKERIDRLNFLLLHSSKCVNSLKRKLKNRKSRAKKPKNDL